MNIRTSIAALTFALVSAASFAATPASVDASSLQKVAATTTATPAAPVRKAVAVSKTPGLRRFAYLRSGAR